MTMENLKSSCILGDFPVEKFLDSHFQKQPLFLKGAVPNFIPPMSHEKLAGLSLEEDVESRLVLDTRWPLTPGFKSQNPYRLLHGPFSKSDFRTLPERDWTLLVQDVDKHVAEVAALLSLVTFLPRWMLDDVMISYAVPGGNVGPHIDQYDVFLLQGSGTRLWQINRDQTDPAFSEEVDLRILERFEPQESYLAEPGDVLYLPPGVAHYGVAQEECTTYSLGLRAPEESALLSAFADELVLAAGENPLREALTTPAVHPAEMTAELTGRARQILEDALRKAKDSAWLGRMLTAPKPHLEGHPLHSPTKASDVQSSLSAGHVYSRSIRSRFLYSSQVDALFLFVDGESYRLSAPSLAFVRRLCEAESVGAKDLPVHPASTSKLLEMMAELVSQGALVQSKRAP